MRNWKFWLFGLGLIAASAVLRFWSLAQTPFANGWDSYFYLVQVKSWVETGRMHSPEASLIYPLLRFFCWLAGDYVLGYKWCAAALAGAWTGVVWWMSGRFRVGFAAFTLFSPHLTYFAAQYPKNLLGLVLLLAFVGSLPDTRRDLNLRGFKNLAGLPAMLLILNHFGHRLTFALALIYLLFWLFFVFGKTLRRVLFTQKTAWAALAGVVALAAASRWLPGLFALADLERLRGVLSARPRFAPWSFVTQFGWDRISGWWLAEIGLAVAAVAWHLCRRDGAIYGAIHRTKAMNGLRPAGVNAGLPALFALCLLLLFPFLDWSFTGISYRFFLVFVLLAPLLAAGTLVFSKKTNRLLAAALLVGALFSWKSYDPKKHDPNYALFAKVTEATERALPSPSGEGSGVGLNEGSEVRLIIAPNALAEFFTFTTGTDAMPWLPEYPLPPEALWRIAANVRQQEIAYFSPGDSLGPIAPLPRRYLLVREDRWQRALARARVENDTDFVERATSWPNPARVRPGYLLGRKE